MSDTKIPLSKQIYSNKETIDFVDSSFSDIIKSKPKLNTKKFFSLYKDLFYKVPKKGQNSHTTLINKSQEYLDDYKDIYADEILQLNDEIERLNGILSNKQSYVKEENIFYPDMTFLKYENDTNPLPVWIMQNGAKRKITNGDTLGSIKKALGHNYDTPTEDIVQKLDLDALSEIPSGPEISSDEDLNLFNFITSIVDLSLAGLIDYTTSLVTCIEGKKDELYDYFKSPSAEGWQINGYSPNEGHNRPRKDYLDGGGCKIYKYGIELNEAGEIYESSRTIYPGETIKVWYRKNPIVNEQEVTNGGKLHNVKGFVREVRKTTGTTELSSEEFRRDEYGRRFSNLQPHQNHLDDVHGNTRVYFYDVPQETDTY